MILNQDDILYEKSNRECVLIAKKKEKGDEILCENLTQSEVTSVFEGLIFIQKIMIECGLQELDVTWFIKKYRETKWFKPTLYIEILSALEHIPMIQKEIVRLESEVSYDPSLFFMKDLQDKNIFSLSVKHYAHIYILAYLYENEPLHFIPMFETDVSPVIPTHSLIKELVMFRKIHERIDKDEDFINSLQSSREFRAFQLKGVFRGWFSM